MKIYDKTDISGEELSAVYSELEIQREVDHSNIARIIGIYEDIDYLIIISELMTCDMR